MLTRRRLLGTAGVAGAAGALTASGALAVGGCIAPGSSSTSGPFDPRDWRSVRAQFSLDAGYAQMAAFVFASHPVQVRGAIDRHRRGLDTDPTGYLEEHEAELENAVTTAAARYLATKPTQLAFTDSTTMGLGLLYSGLKLGPGDEVLTTEHDFYATHEALRLLAAREGVTVRRVRLYADPAKASVDEIVDNLRRAVNGGTKVVAVTWVHSSTGVRLPIRQLADVVHGQSDALLCVDAVHGFGAVDTTPDALQADFFVSGCHKWLFGPRGTGLVWGTDRGWGRYTPVIPAFDRNEIGNWMFGTGQPVDAGRAATPGGYHSFEHRWALADAFAFHLAIGRAAVGTRTTTLATRLKEGLAGIGRVTLRTPTSADLSAGVVCCEIAGVNPAEAVRRLRGQKVIATASPYATSYLRFGTSIASTEADVDATVKAVRALA